MKTGEFERRHGIPPSGYYKVSNWFAICCVSNQPLTFKTTITYSDIHRFNCEATMGSLSLNYKTKYGGETFIYLVYLTSKSTMTCH